MSESAELASLDLRYQGHRLRDDAREARLLASIAERGIEDPLEGADTPLGRFLLNGFKRYRCAKKLDIQSVPYQSLAEKEATGILNLMRVSTDMALGILEQVSPSWDSRRKCAMSASPRAVHALFRLSVATFVISCSAIYDWYRFDRVRNGVVAAHEATPRKGNADSYEPALTAPLNEGAEFVVVEQRGDWLRIRLPTDHEGWC